MAVFLDDIITGFEKDDSLGVAGMQFSSRSKVSSVGMTLNLVTTKAVTESKVLCWLLWIICSPLQPPELLLFGRLGKDPHQDPP